MKSRTTVTTPESISEPRQPSRFEKKKNISVGSGNFVEFRENYLPGRKTTLITPSSLSRNFLYIAGASSRLAGCVTTKLGSISPACMSFISSFV
jgi:hypothetical protein